MTPPPDTAYPDIAGPVFPCGPSKRPLTAHGFKSASADPTVIDEWAWRHPGCLWGYPLPEGVFVVDVDPRHGGDRTLTTLLRTHGALPETRTTRTGSGGSHLWFTTDRTVRQTAGELGPGIDTRVGGRGYVIVPNSPGYQWTVRGPISGAPAWLVDLLEQRDPEPKPIPAPSTMRAARYGNVALDNAARAVASSTNGARNAELNRQAFGIGRLVGGGLVAVDLAWDALLAAALAAGLDQREAERTITSGLTSGSARPRGGPLDRA